MADRLSELLDIVINPSGNRLVQSVQRQETLLQRPCKIECLDTCATKQQIPLMYTRNICVVVGIIDTDYSIFSIYSSALTFTS